MRWIGVVVLLSVAYGWPVEVDRAGADPAVASDQAKEEKQKDTAEKLAHAKRIKQLVAQLDADAFLEREAAEAALKNIGTPAAASLVRAAKDGSLEVRMRAKRCLVAIRKQRIIDGFTELSRAKDDQSIDLEEGMWLMSLMVNAAAEKRAIARKLDDLADEVHAALGKNVEPAKADPRKVVAALRQVLVTKHGFNGNHDDYRNPANSSIEAVLRTKKGLPILLSHVYVAVGQRLKVPLVGLQVPGQYMLKYDGSQAPAGFAKDDIIIDPHESGRMLTVAQLAEFVGDGFDKDAHLAPSGHRDALLRMLSNLRTHFSLADRPDAAKQAEFVGQMQSVLAESVEVE